LVVILFDAAIDDMRRAASAIQAGDIEQRATAIRHAMLVLQQLQGTLDFEKGGEVAKRFEQFYNLIRAKLLESQLRNSPELMQQQIQFMSEVRDCWMHAEKQLHATPNPGPAVATVASARATPEDGGPTSEWNA
ncbi:MAG: flagellar protein FliS, partial [Candidatus Korobacteraceae bacterium]